MEKRVLKNASWIIGCKIIRSALVFVIGMLTARYLGPSNYGLISYAASVVAFFTPIMQLGMSATLVREFIATPERESKILGTSLVLNILSALACVVGVTIFSWVANPGETETTIVCFLYSLMLIMQASEMTQYWFQAKLMSKYPAIASLVAYVIGSAYKIYLLLTGKSIYWFAVTHTIEALVIAVMLMATYFCLGGGKLSFSFTLGREMLSRSKYYIIAGMMMVVYQQTDRIMLKMMLNEAATGFYSAAISCIGISGFVFSAILDSARPSILESRQKSQAAYEKRMMMLFSVITGVSLLQSIGMSLLAKPMIWVIYGEAYLPAVPVLRIAVWYVTFGYYGSVRNIWILAEEKQQYLWIIDLSGAVCNVLCNLMMIPIWGACGAAAASLITQVLINFVLCLSMRATRPCGVLILKSFRMENMVGIIRSLTNRK
jgi:O-antigen/teichoic acid export membrane protein